MSTTLTTELQELPGSSRHESKPQSISSLHGHRLGQSSLANDDDGVGLPPPSTAVQQSQRWNEPGINMWRVFATFYSFVVVGANDGVYGAIIPYLEIYYNKSYVIISLVFLSPFCGYVIASMTNNTVHEKLGQRGIAMIGCGLHLLAYALISLHPPFPALIVILILAGLGNGLIDASWNAWIGDMANANQLMGFLHGFYGLGAALMPLAATSVITKAGWEWYECYYIMAGAAAVEVITSTIAFWGATGAKYREIHESEAAAQPLSPASATSPRSPVKQSFLQRFFDPKNAPTVAAMQNKVTWITSFFLLFYVGVEVSIGGWIVTFMLRVRHGTPFASGLVSTGFWMGIAVGRVILGFVTPLFPSEKSAIAVYLLLSMALELIFWLVPHFIVSAIAISVIGFFLGPVFPGAVVAQTKLLPKHLHVASVGFACALGASGATILPFMVGAIAQSKGVNVLQPVVLALLVVCLGLWLCLPRLPKTRTA